MDAEIPIHALLPYPSISRINIMVSLQVDPSAIPSRERDGGSPKINRYQNCLIINPHPMKIKVLYIIKIETIPRMQMREAFMIIFPNLALAIITTTRAPTMIWILNTMRIACFQSKGESMNYGGRLEDLMEDSMLVKEFICVDVFNLLDLWSS